MNLDAGEAFLLEEFVWKAQARTRMVMALGRLRHNLKFPRPKDKVDKPVSQQGKSKLGIGSCQALAAQPGTRVKLNEELEASWLAGGPMRPAFLPISSTRTHA